MARFPDFTSEDFVVHRQLLGSGITIVEGATNLGALRGVRQAQVFAPFFKIAGTEGAPARIFALVED